MRFKKSFLITLLFHVLILVLDKGASLIILRILRDRAPEVGGIHLLTNLPPILMAVSNLGLATSLVYFMRRDEVSVRTAGQTTSVVALVWGFAIALLAFVAIRIWSLVDPRTDLPTWSLLLPVLMTPPFLLIISYRNSIQLVLNRIFGYNLVHLVPSLTYLPVFLLVFFVISDEDAYHSAVYARFVPAVALALGLAWVLRRDVPLAMRFDRGFFRKALSFGWRANINSTVTVLNHRLDLYVVGAIFVVNQLNPEQASRELINQEVAFYSLAVTLAELIWHFPEAMRDLLFAKVAGMNEAEARDFTPVVCRNSLFICACGAVLIWFVHDPLLSLWLGHSWHATWQANVSPALAVLLPGTVCFTAAKVLQADLMARGRINTCIFLTSSVLVTMLTADVILVPHGGAGGAALASTIAYATGAIASLMIYARLTGTSVFEAVLPRIEDWRHYRELIGRARGRARA